MSKILSSLVLLVLIPNAAVAQITPDSSLGAENSVVDSNGDRDTIEGGAIRDTNLFHSFQEFNVGAGREAYFANPNGIVNIFSRVTGNNISNILGTLGVLGDANLFFMNPNGIVFGANARLDVRGSFLGSTADSLVFENGFEFSASNPQAPPLLTIGIPLGLNFRENPGDIVNQSVANNGNGLQVATGESITLIGGNVDLDGGKIFAGGGRVELGGLSAAGEIGLNSDGSLSFPDDVARADVSIINGARVDVRAGGGGSITIDARNLEIREGSQLLAGIREGLGTPEAQAGDLTINATNTVLFDNRSFAFNDIDSGGVGHAGDVSVTISSLEVTNGARLTSDIVGQGNGGSVTIKATDSVKFDGDRSGAASQVASGAKGNAGDVSITTGSLEVTNGATLSASTFGKGDAGSVTINATDSVKFDGEGVFTGAFSRVNPGAEGNAGDVSITTSSLEITNGAQLGASTFGEGNGGSVTIKSTDSVKLDGEGKDGNFFSVAGSQVASGAKGNAGDVSITTGSLEVTNGARLDASTFGEGNGGSVTIKATDSVNFDGESKDGRSSSGASSTVSSRAEANAGDVSINTGSLQVLNGAQVFVSTFGGGDAGSVTITATDSVKFDGESKDGSRSSGVFSVVNPGVEGNAGGVSITTGSLEVTNGARVSASTVGKGDAGSIEINANTFEASNGSILDSFTSSQFSAGNILLKVKENILLSGSDTGIFANTTEDSTGKGGNIIVEPNPKTLTIRDGATISVDSQGEGIGGDIELAAGFLTLDNGTISAETLSNTGGNIILNLQDLLLLNNGSQISTTAGNQEFGGNGGNITINTPFIVAFPNENSDITANAFEGTGGQINITAQGIFGIEERKASEENQTNDIDASSEFGSFGVVEINQPDVDPTRGLVELPETVVDPNALVAQNPCKRSSESEFVITGRGGLPPSLNEDLSSDATQVGLVEPAPMEVEEQESRGAEDKTSSSPSVPTTIIPAQGWVFNERGEIILVAYDPTITGSQRLKENSTSCPTSGRN